MFLKTHKDYFHHELKPESQRAQYTGLKLAYTEYLVKGELATRAEYVVWGLGFYPRGMTPEALRMADQDSVERICKFLFDVIRKRLPSSVIMYLISPAEQVRIALGKTPEFQTKFMRQKSNFLDTGKSVMAEEYDLSLMEKVDREAVGRRRNFDQQWEAAILGEQEKRLKEQGRALLYGPDGQVVQ